MSLLQDAWEEFNSDDSWAPLLLPLLGWSVGYMYCQAHKDLDFHEFHLVHNVHNAGAMLLGVVSLYYNDDSRFHERIHVLWHVSYFLVDLMDCLIRQDKVYTFHSLLALLGGYVCMTDPVLVSKTRIASRFSFLELSNPLRYVAVKTKKPLHSGMFFLVFTFCRILYMPFIIRVLLVNGFTWTNRATIVTIMIYALQLWWWKKMIRILIKFSRGETVHHEIKEDYHKEE